MIEKILKTLNDYSMLGNAKRITVALSGGADSVALLNVLNSLKEIFNFELTAAHFNHKIRGKEADRDENFCKDICKKIGVNIFIGTADVPAVSKEKKQSLELAARECRYAFFDSLDTDLVATAHTASDNIETVIFNITRGTGLAGLCGIPPKRGKYIRPLIYCTRQEIERYCTANELTFVNDSTNDIDDCSRNIIRHKVIPALKEINPSLENTALGSTALFAADNNCLEHAAEIVYKNALKEEGLSVKTFAHLDKAVISRILRIYYKSVCGSSADLKHINELVDLCERGGTISLKDKRTATCKNGFLKIEEPFVKTEFSVTLDYADNDFFGEDQKVNNLLLKNMISCDNIKGELIVRKRLPGDKIRLGKRGVTKTFKNLYNEYKIPLCERDNLPVIADEEGPLWVYKIGVASRCVVGDDTKKVCIINTQVKQPENRGE